MLGIDETIGEVERLFRAVTGQDVPKTHGPYAPIPAERDPSQYVSEQVDRLNKLLGDAQLQTNDLPPVIPPLTIYETADEIVIAVQMPGVSKEALHVESRGRVVVVTGQPRIARRAGARLLTAEHPQGPYQRMIPLPAGTTAADLNAQISDGLLELRIRNTPRDNPVRDIPVR